MTGYNTQSIYVVMKRAIDDVSSNPQMAFSKEEQAEEYLSETCEFREEGRFWLEDRGDKKDMVYNIMELELRS